MVTSSSTQRLSMQATEVPRNAGLAFDVIVTFMILWLTVGVFIDGYAHGQGIVETFFTPWHAVLYSGFCAAAWTILGRIIYRKQRGVSWREAVPEGYLGALIGIILFGFFGFSDFVWHQYFGFEIGVELLLSPPHLLLAVGGVLMSAGPILSGMHRQNTPSFVGALPSSICASLILSILAFMLQYNHPLTEFWNTRPTQGFNHLYIHHSLGTLAIFLHNIFLMGLLLWVGARIRLPFGYISVCLGVNAVAVLVLYEEFPLIPFIVLGSVTVDLLYLWLQPTLQKRPRWLLFAGGAPLLYWGAYLLGMQQEYSVGWSGYIWLGTITASGCLGLLLAGLMLGAQPPKPAA